MQELFSTACPCYSKAGVTKNDNDMKQRTRKSAVVSLTLIGSALSGCSDNADLIRDVYNDYADCMAEWGDSSLCEEQQSDIGGDARTVFYGPPYKPGHRPDYVLGFGKSIATESVEKAGFGQTAETLDVAGG